MILSYRMSENEVHAARMRDLSRFLARRRCSRSGRQPGCGRGAGANATLINHGTALALQRISLH